MSYILDALKKNQIEDQATGVSLDPPRRGTPRWLALGLVAVILINLALVGWIMWNQTDRAQEATTPVTARTPSADQTPPVTATVTPPAPSTGQRVEAVTQPVREVAAAPTPQPVTRPQPRVRPAPRHQLRDLPAGEQILYNGFTYSTHIYTDDPSLCAIVVNGQRLTAGDTFQGLKVVAITEAGVVFEENRRGQRREVEVSVIEQWDNE